MSHFGRWRSREGRGKYLSGYRSTNNLKTKKRPETKEDRSSSEETIRERRKSEWL